MKRLQFSEEIRLTVDSISVLCKNDASDVKHAFPRSCMDPSGLNREDHISYGHSLTGTIRRCSYGKTESERHAE